MRSGVLSPTNVVQHAERPLSALFLGWRGIGLCKQQLQQRQLLQPSLDLRLYKSTAGVASVATSTSTAEAAELVTSELVCVLAVPGDQTLLLGVAQP